jgi:hypothetical protein
MLPADVAAFSVGLKAAFPAIRFVSIDYWQHFVDQERWEADCREWRRRDDLGLPKPKLRRHMRDPAGALLHYWDALADPAETRFLVWIEPPGWRPVWSQADEDGIRYIENTPRLWFEFQRSTFRPKYPKWLIHLDDEPRVGARDTLVLEGRDFEVRWNPAEPAAEAFGKKVYNILRKLTGCEFKGFEPESRRAFTPDTYKTQKLCLAGRHALAWSLERRHNYLKSDSWGMLLKSSEYRFLPGDVFTKAEYEQFLAAREAEFEAKLKRLNEEHKERARARAASGEPPTLDLIVEGTGGLSGLKMRFPIGKSGPRTGR